MPWFETPEDFLQAIKDDKVEDAVAWNLANMESLFPEIAEALAVNTRLKFLTIHNCGITDEVAQLLAESLLQNSTLRTFDYSHVPENATRSFLMRLKQNKMTLHGLNVIGSAWNARSERGRVSVIEVAKFL
uniref:Uncharacterized protein n=1 Tax=Guillardia theta TaxID=55529 RepID=A0A6U6BD33_GUITH|mmetsp:Transcript_35019/g.109455  ORF Transcript_35019/g.109455 Transcript_35019/m.109455 type:complete len:131 (+) Transcript_35019:233-625(+)